MALLLRTLPFRHFHTLLKPPQNPSQYLISHYPLLLHIPSTTTTTPHCIIPSIFFHRVRSISLSAQFQPESISLDHDDDDNNSSSSSSSNKEDNQKTKKPPLHLLFKEAVGLAEKVQHSAVDNEVETNELKKKLRKLEEEVRKLKENNRENEKVKNLNKSSRNDDGVLKLKGETNSISIPKSLSLYSLFVNNYKAADNEKSVDMDMDIEHPMVYKELSPELVLFVTHLYNEGYFNNANFLPRNKFDVTYFENSYGRNFIKFAAEKFGKDYQEIAKWLSASDLKKVALFGCPSLGRKNVFSAKKLRTFFRIQEDTVCSKCALKTSCKFVNQSVWKGDNKNLNLAVVMRVITLYALESVPPKLVVPNEIKASVSRLLKEVLNLSQTVA